MRTTASPARRDALPKSLVERLTLLASGQLPPVRRAASGRSGPAAAYLGMLLCFGLGAVAGGAIGGAALLGLQALAAGEVRTDATSVVSQGLTEAPPPPDTFVVAIDHSQRTRAPLPLQVTGSEDGSLQIAIRGVPEGARLSRGEQRDPSTWVVRRDDLDDLYLKLGDAVPEAFDVRIDVLAPPDVAALGSIVRVRLVDLARQKQTPAAVKDQLPGHQDQAAAAVTEIAKAAQAHTPAATRSLDTGRGEKPAKAPAQQRAPPGSADASAPGPKATPAHRHWPEGASGLGAVPRETERQVWWTMPPPSWSPFLDPGGTN